MPYAINLLLLLYLFLCFCHIFLLLSCVLTACLLSVFYTFVFLGSILNFQFEWLLVWLGFFIIIVSNILLLLNKIPIKIFLFFFVVVNIFTFGVNLLSYWAGMNAILRNVFVNPFFGWE